MSALTRVLPAGADSSPRRVLTWLVEGGGTADRADVGALSWLLLHDLAAVDDVGQWSATDRGRALLARDGAS